MGLRSRQVLDRYFGNVCELDLIFNFHKAYHILDELLITGSPTRCPLALSRPLAPSPGPHRASLALARRMREPKRRAHRRSPTHTCASPRSPVTPVTPAGELQEPSKKAILRVTAAQDALMEGSGDSKVSDSKYEI